MGKQKVTSIQISVNDAPMTETFRDRSQHSRYRQQRIPLCTPHIIDETFAGGEATRFP
jgi:hypothetical protein